MKMFLVTMLLMVVTALSGCATNGGKISTTHQRIEVACAGTGAALAVLAVANDNHKLTKAQVSKISEAKAVIDPTCNPASGDYPYTMSEASLQALETAALFVKKGSSP